MEQQYSADESDDNQSMVTVCPNNTEDTLILHPTDPSDYINANVNTLMSSDDQHDDEEEDDDDDEIEYSNQINTIVQVINPLLVGDGAATEIAIGHSDDLSSFNNELRDYDDGVHFRQELSINDKMKNVLKELKQNEKVRLSWSRSMEEDDDEDIENFEKYEKECEENDDNNIVSTSYEEKTGSIGTVFMVRERLINDFYDHQHHDIDNQASIDSCQVYSNPSVDEFLAHEIQHSQESLSARKEALTLDLTATATPSQSNENGDEDEENDDDEDTSTTDNTPSTPTKSLVYEEGTSVGSSNTNNNPSKKKRRKGKNKSKK